MTDDDGGDDQRKRELGTARTELGVGDYKTEAVATGDPTANLKPGRTTIDAPEIPGYRITDVVGEGGMGTVYAALQESPHRKVAIKILHRGSHSALVRFQTEAAIMARLDHPSIANIVEAGEADGKPFLVMDFIEGKTLDDHVEHLPLAPRLTLFAAICDAVHHAHVNGVIHRDLKPSNVMVRDGERVVVLDFGIARLANDSTPGPTRAGELVGTPLYMSPEQARLRPDEVDARTDIYTLGVMLYELACDQLPYEAPRDVPLPVLTVMICDEPPVPLSRRAPQLRGDLEAIVAKALAKEPRDRYQSVAALAEDVRHFLAGEPVSVRMPTTLERAGLFVRRRPIVAASIAGAFVAVVVFSTVVTALWIRAREARSLAEQATVRTETARDELAARTTELTLKQARSALARDPTEALAWLATLPPSAQLDARVAWMIADEARARGVAKDILRAHTDEVHSVRPLGNAVVSGGYDGRVIVWDPAPTTVFTSDQGRVHVAIPSPDGARIAVGGDGGLLAVVRRDGSGLERLGTLAGDVHVIVWSPDGRWLAAATDRGGIALFEHGTGRGTELAVAGKDGSSPVQSLAFAGPLLVAGTEDGNVRSWRMGTAWWEKVYLGTPILGLWGDGSRVVSVDADGTVVERGPVARKHATGIRPKRVVFDPRGTYVLLGGVGGELAKVSTETGDVERIHTHRALVRSLALSPDGRWIGSGGDDGSLVVYDQQGNRLLALLGHTGRVRDLAFAGTTLYSSDSDGTIRRWELTELGVNVLASAGPRVLHLAAHGGYIAAVDELGGVTRWSVDGTQRRTFAPATGRVTELVVSEHVVVSGHADGTLGWHRRKDSDRPLEEPLPKLGGSIRAVAHIDDGLVIASADGAIVQTSLHGGRVRTLPGHVGGTDALAVSPDGRHVASGGQDRVIRLWRRDTNPDFVAAGELDGPTGDTHFLAYSPDGTRLVAAGNDGIVFAWSVRDGIVDPASRVQLAKHTGAVTALAVARDVVVSAGRDLQLIRVTREGASERAALPAAATELALGSSGDAFALTRSGAAWRWAVGGAPVVEIDHGVVAAAAIDASRWVLGFDDGAIVVVGLGPSSLGDLHARIAALTTYRLPSE